MMNGWIDRYKGSTQGGTEDGIHWRDEQGKNKMEELLLNKGGVLKCLKVILYFIN